MNIENDIPTPEQFKSFLEWTPQAKKILKECIFQFSIAKSTDKICICLEPGERAEDISYVVRALREKGWRVSQHYDGDGGCGNLFIEPEFKDSAGGLIDISKLESEDVQSTVSKKVYRKKVWWVWD